VPPFNSMKIESWLLNIQSEIWTWFKRTESVTFCNIW
jgi:hypothetical protein